MCQGWPVDLTPLPGLQNEFSCKAGNFISDCKLGEGEF